LGFQGAELRCRVLEVNLDGLNRPKDGWQPSVSTAASQHIYFDRLTPGTTCTVQVRALGGSTGQSDWSDPTFSRGPPVVRNQRHPTP